MPDPRTRPAPAEENAGAVHPLPQGGEGEKPRKAEKIATQMWELQVQDSRWLYRQKSSVVGQFGVAPTPQGGVGILGLCRAKARRYKTKMSHYPRLRPLAPCVCYPLLLTFDL